MGHGPKSKVWVWPAQTLAISGTDLLEVPTI